VAGDYHEGDLSGVMNDNPLVADVVDTWIKRGQNRSTFCFAVDRAHAKHLQTKFTEAGVTTGYIDAFTPLHERDEVYRNFSDGSIRVVCNVGCLTTGIDWDVRCIILARPTKSEILFVQIVGRGLRVAEGKDDCLILDHSDTHIRLGFVTDIHHDVLDDGRERVKLKSDRVRLPRECPKCTFLKSPKLRECPACGFKAEAVSNIEVGDGELVEVSGRRTATATTDDKQRWYSMLLQVGNERGYKPGWVANQYRQKFGVWPRGLAEMPMQPNKEVWNYVRYSMIRYAKSRKPDAQQATA
jgi:superfamily II DNA or RNA helicase